MVIEKPMPSDTYITDDRSQELDQRRLSQNIAYPKAIYFIIANEFFERFTYYGITSILSLYLKEQLEIPSSNVTVVSQIFLMFSYCFPILGACLADCYLGKYKTVLFMSPLYAAGTFVVIISTLPNMPGTAIAMTGLVLTYLGLGGVRPCVVAFGAEQFVLPQQESHMKKYFSIFYFTINAGSFVASITIPALSERHCLGEELCFFAGFWGIFIAITSAAIIFASGTKFYYKRTPDCNIVLKVLKCIVYALSKRQRHDKTPGHWLDRAQDRYDPMFINDVKIVLRILVLYIPLPFFRALFDQHGFRWHVQAARMSGDIGKLKLEAEQMNSANSIFILLFIPLFEAFVYPMFARYNFLKKPLQRMTAGGLLAAVAFVVSALVEVQLESTDEYLPRPNEAQLRLYNGLPESIQLEFVTPSLGSFSVPSLSLWSKLDLPAKGAQQVTIRYPINGTTATENLDITENALTSYIFTPQNIIRIDRDEVEKSKDGAPKVMIIYIQPKEEAEVMAVHCETEESFVIRRSKPYTTYEETLDCDSYHVEENGKVIFRNVEMKQGGVYVAFLAQKGTEVVSNLLTVIQPNSVHMLWLVPQYVLITAGEVLFSITGFEFSFTQAPVSMKALLQAAWLLTAALGKVIVLSAGRTKLFERLFSEFLLFAALMTVDMFVFAALAVHYTYVKTSKEDEAGPSSEK